MLDTFDNEMILSAVQQLTTEVQRVEGKANKIPVNPEIPAPAVADAGKVLGVDESGNYALVEAEGGWELLMEKSYDDLDISSTAASTFDTITMPEDFEWPANKLMVVDVQYEPPMPDNPKMVRTLSIISNLSDRTTGAINTRVVFQLYYQSNGILNTNAQTFGIYMYTYTISTRALVLYASSGGSSYGDIVGKAKVKIYFVELPE